MTSKGFNKQGVKAKMMEVDPDEVQRMQQGYEQRIARQAASITRLLGLLEERTQDVKNHMDRANAAAAQVEDPSTVPVVVVTHLDGSDETKAWLDGWALVGALGLEDFDEVPDNERHLPQQFIVHYIRTLRSRIESGGEKQQALVRERDELEAALRQAQADAANNAKVANQAMASVGEIGDETPPWEKAPYVAPTVMQRHTPSDQDVPEDMLGVTETITGWADMTLPPGETRPGGF